MASERHWPSWRDVHGVVHMVGLRTGKSIRTECGLIIVRSSKLEVQLRYYEEAYASPNCIECTVEWEPY